MPLSYSEKAMLRHRRRIGRRVRPWPILPCLLAITALALAAWIAIALLIFRIMTIS